MILDIERVAHGGICIAHAPDGRAVFVRHTLPGERVRVAVTEERPRYLRADAVEVLRAAPARVEPPCPYARPGRCGGCDWQHVELAEQRRLKAAVVTEQLRRLAGLERDVVVEPAETGETGLHWRTRLRLGVDAGGRAGLHRYRSHEIEPVDDCLIALERADVPDVVRRRWEPGSTVAVDVSSTGERALSVGAADAAVTEEVAGHTFAVPVGGFWQVHRRAPQVLVDAVLAAARPRPGDVALDLYAGVGLFAAALAAAGARVTAVEADRRAAAAAAANVPDATVVRARVDRWLRHAPAADVVVLDPPRRGAGRDVVAGVAALAARTVVHVACDPAALARDVALLADAGYRLDGLRAFDLFPMTAHVECVASFRPERG